MILKSKINNKFYKIICSRKYDYIDFYVYYLYNNKIKRTYGSRKSIGWFTRRSSAIKSLRNMIKDNLIIYE